MKLIFDSKYLIASCVQCSLTSLCLCVLACLPYLEGKCTYQFIVNEVDPKSCPNLLQQPAARTVATTTVSPDGHVFYQGEQETDNYPAPSGDGVAKDMFNSFRTFKTRTTDAENAKVAELTGIVKGLEGEIKQMNKDFIVELQSLELKVSQEMVKNRDLENKMETYENQLESSSYFFNASVELSNRRHGQVAAMATKNTEEIKVIQGLMTKMDKILTEHRNLISDLNERPPAIPAYLPEPIREIPKSAELKDRNELTKSTKKEDKIILVKAASQTMCQGMSSGATTYTDCQAIYERGHKASGVYYVKPMYVPCSIPVYCDMETSGGGWLLIQKRVDGSLSFSRKWREYKNGFGDVTHEFWLGNDNIFLITNQESYTLRVDMWDFEDEHRFAEYLYFNIGGERDRYRLLIMNHTGSAPDGFQRHNGALFSTPDEDNDSWPDYHCAEEWQAGWWFNNCWFVFLNGKHHNSSDVKYRGISWNEWKAEQLKRVEMKIRPSPYM